MNKFVGSKWEGYTQDKKIYRSGVGAYSICNKDDDAPSELSDKFKIYFKYNNPDKYKFNEDVGAIDTAPETKIPNILKTLTNDGLLCIFYNDVLIIYDLLLEGGFIFNDVNIVYDSIKSELNTDELHHHTIVGYVDNENKLYCKKQYITENTFILDMDYVEGATVNNQGYFYEENRNEANVYDFTFNYKNYFVITGPTTVQIGDKVISQIIPNSHIYYIGDIEPVDGMITFNFSGNNDTIIEVW